MFFLVTQTPNLKSPQKRVQHEHSPLATVTPGPGTGRRGPNWIQVQFRGRRTVNLITKPSTFGPSLSFAIGELPSLGVQIFMSVFPIGIKHLSVGCIQSVFATTVLTFMPVNKYHSPCSKRTILLSFLQHFFSCPHFVMFKQYAV